MSDQKRVLILNESAGPGGAEQVVLATAIGLSLSNWDVLVATFRTGWLTEQLDKNNISRVVIKAGGKFAVGLPFRIARLISSRKISLVHSHLLDSNFYTSIGASLAAVPHLATEHGDVHHSSERRFLKTKIKTISAFDSTFSAVSDFTASKLLDFGVEKDKVVTIGNPVHVRPCDKEIARRDIRRELGLKETDWLWLHVANMRPVKDQETLLRAFARCLDEGSKVQKLAFVGDGELRQSLQNLAKDLGVAHLTHFAGHRNDVERWLAASDGFVLSSLSEAMPMSLLEAGHNALLVIASNVGGIPELIGHNQTGYLFEKGDYKRLGTLMATAAYSTTSEQLAKNLQKKIHDDYSISTIVSKYICLYEKLLADA